MGRVGGTIEAANVTVDATSRIHADGLGYTGTEAAGNGPGGGAGDRNRTHGGGGGGHGDAGGAGNSSYAGGAAYGLPLEPVELGSAGGAGYGGAGGAGGGSIRVMVSSALQLDGRISADGATGSGGNDGDSGGGAGGSVWITTEVLAGAGRVTANGGAGASQSYLGGGGGGGRIAVYCREAGEFTGWADCTVEGGGGNAVGGRGTLSLHDADEVGGHLRVVGHYLLEPGAAFPYDRVELRALGVLEVAAGASLAGVAQLDLGDQTRLVLDGAEIYQFNLPAGHRRRDGP